MLTIKKADKGVMSLGETIELAHHNIIHNLAMNDNIVRLLMSESPDCLDLEVSEQDRDMIFDETDVRKCRVFNAPFVPKTEEVSCAQLRIYTPSLHLINEYTVDIYICIDIIVDVTVNRLTKGKRWFRLMAEILNSVSGKDVGGIGRLQLIYDDIPLVCFKDDFWGYTIPFKIKAGTN